MIGRTSWVSGGSEQRQRAEMWEGSPRETIMSSEKFIISIEVTASRVQLLYQIFKPWFKIQAICWLWKRECQSTAMTMLESYELELGVMKIVHFENTFTTWLGLFAIVYYIVSNLVTTSFQNTTYSSDNILPFNKFIFIFLFIFITGLLLW